MSNNEIVRREAVESAKSIVTTFDAGAKNNIPIKSTIATALIASTPFVMTPILWSVHPILGIFSGITLFGTAGISWVASSVTISEKVRSHERELMEMYLTGDFSEDKINAILAGQNIPLRNKAKFSDILKKIGQKWTTNRKNLNFSSYSKSLFKKQVGVSKTVYANGGGFELTYVYKRFSIISVDIKFFNNAEDEWEKAYAQVSGLTINAGSQNSIEAPSVMKSIESNIRRVMKELDL